MSAYQCSERELTILARYALTHCFEAVPYELRSELDPPRIGHHGPLEKSPGAFERAVARVFAALHAENVASLRELYGPAAVAEMWDAPAFVHVPSRVGPFPPALHVIKACHHYAYQSCEHDGWPGSVARAIVNAIEADAVRRLPGYLDAPWGL